MQTLVSLLVLLLGVVGLDENLDDSLARRLPSPLPHERRREESCHDFSCPTWERPTPSPSDPCQADGRIYEPFDTLFFERTAQACKERCQTEAGCVYFNYFGSGRTDCRLSNGYFGWTKDHDHFGLPATVLSGFKHCSGVQCDKSALAAIDFAGMTGVWRETGMTNDGEAYDFACASGYTASGAAMCSYGQWNLDDLRCNRIPCSTIELPNGEAILDDGSTGTYGDDFTRSFIVECDQGFSESVAEVECVRGEWSETPTCVESRCPTIEVDNVQSIENVNVDNVPLTLDNGAIPEAAHDTLVKFVCVSGYSPRPEHAEVECVRGEWSTATCNPASCYNMRLNVQLPGAATTTTNNGLTKHGEVYDFKCASGYTASGDAMCSYGQWNLDDLRCNPDSCDKRTLPINARANSRMGRLSYWAGPLFVDHGSSYEHKCVEGYTASGAALCFAGKWTTDEGVPLASGDLKCNRKPCTTLELQNGVDITDDDDESGTDVDAATRSMEAVHGTSFPVECDPGFSESVAEVVCCRGEWSVVDSNGECDYLPNTDGAPLEFINPTCDRIPCTTLELQHGEDILDDGSTGTYVDPYNRVFVVECGEGYKESVPIAVCRRGEWSDPPTCDGGDDAEPTSTPPVSGGEVDSSPPPSTDSELSDE